MGAQVHYGFQNLALCVSPRSVEYVAVERISNSGSSSINTAQWQVSVSFIFRINTPAKEEIKQSTFQVAIELQSFLAVTIATQEHSEREIFLSPFQASSYLTAGGHRHLRIYHPTSKLKLGFKLLGL